MTGAPAADRPPHFRRLLYSTAISVGVSFGAILYGTSVLITTEAAGSEFSISQLSLAFSGSVVTGAAVAVPVGRFADRHGVRRLLALGGALVFLGFLGFSLATQLWQVLASWWLLIGPGSAMALFEPAFVALQQWFGRSLRNRAAGLLTVVTGLAGPVFIPSTSALVGLLGWRPTAALLGACVLLASSAASGWALRVAPLPGDRREPPAGEGAAVGHPGPTAPGAAAAQGGRAGPGRLWGLPPGFIPLTAAMGLCMAVLESFNVHRIARFEVAGFDPGVLAWWAAAVGLLSLPARFLLPLLADRFPAATISGWLTVLMLPAVLLAVRGTSAWEMTGHFILFGLLFGAFMPLRAVLMSDWFSGARFGALMGVQAMAIAAGRAAGPALVGWLADTPVGYPGGMLLLAGMLVLSLVMLMAAVRRRRSAGAAQPA